MINLLERKMATNKPEVEKEMMLESEECRKIKNNYQFELLFIYQSLLELQVTNLKPLCFGNNMQAVEPIYSSGSILER